MFGCVCDVCVNDCVMPYGVLLRVRGCCACVWFVYTCLSVLFVMHCVALSGVGVVACLC